MPGSPPACPLVVLSLSTVYFVVGVVAVGAVASAVWHAPLCTCCFASGFDCLLALLILLHVSVASYVQTLVHQPLCTLNMRYRLGFWHRVASISPFLFPLVRHPQIESVLKKPCHCLTKFTSHEWVPFDATFPWGPTSGLGHVPYTPTSTT